MLLKNPILNFSSPISHNNAMQVVNKDITHLIYPLKKKSDTANIFLQFKKLIENYFQTSIRSVFSDNGGEYQKLIPIFNSYGISHFTIPPHTPEHNGTAERCHWHIVETGLSLLHFASLPSTYWSYAFQATVYLIN